MITKKELQDFARLKNLTLGNAEKDYLIDIALLSISKNTKNELIFKGGTCLYKFYKLSRFSEDLDFSLTKDIDVNKLIEKILLDFQRFGINAVQHLKKEPHNSVLITLRIQGPLFTGNTRTYSSLGIDINLKSSVVLEPELLACNSIYPELPSINVLSMNPKEIFAEKIRAIMTRTRARDLFDLYFLLNKGVYSDKKLIEEKMEYYNQEFDIKKLNLRIKDLKEKWTKELKGFTSYLPNFEDVSKDVSNNLSKLYK